MKINRDDPRSLKNLLRLIQDGAIEAVRVEVERRRQAGLPLRVEQNGRLITIWPDGRQTPLD